MADRKKDELAEALAAMAAGQIPAEESSDAADPMVEPTERRAPASPPAAPPPAPSAVAAPPPNPARPARKVVRVPVTAMPVASEKGSDPVGAKHPSGGGGKRGLTPFPRPAVPAPAPRAVPAASAPRPRPRPAAPTPRPATPQEALRLTPQRPAEPPAMAPTPAIQAPAAADEPQPETPAAESQQPAGELESQPAQPTNQAVADENSDDVQVQFDVNVESAGAGEAAEDDLLNMPAPSPEVFARKATPAAPPRPPARTGAMMQSLEFKRTLIPILLTCGLLLVITGVMSIFGDSDEAIGSLKGPFSAFLIGGGALLLGLGAVNIAQVGRQAAPAKAISGAEAPDQPAA